jgi:hypothetical protein
MLTWAADAASAWKGKWSSENSGNSGDIQIALKPEPRVSFTLSGQEVPCTVVSSKSDGENVEIAYDFNLQGYKLRSSLKGTVKDGKLQGKYTTTTVEDGSAVDSGSFEGTAR